MGEERREGGREGQEDEEGEGEGGWCGSGPRAASETARASLDKEAARLPTKAAKIAWQLLGKLIRQQENARPTKLSSDTAEKNVNELEKTNYYIIRGRRVGPRDKTLRKQDKATAPSLDWRGSKPRT